MKYRVGNGFDVHAFEDGRELWLGGIKIEGHRGLSGHSDADVLIHAIIDSLLGAAGIGDIGELFPDSDPAYKGIRSIKLLEQTVERLYAEGWTIENVDTTVICETPKISKYKAEMRKVLSGIMSIAEDCMMVKGKTTEKLGFTGRGEGIAAMSSVLLSRR